MRNHSNSSRNRLARDGGSLAPSPGRTPRGAKKIEMNPASSSIPSDWYDEKSCSAPTHDMKSSVQSATVSRGHTLTVRSTEQTMPAATTAVSAASLALAQNKVGASQKRASP